MTKVEIVTYILGYMGAGFLTALSPFIADYLDRLRGTESQVAAMFICGLLWPLLVTYGVLWCLYQLRYIYKPFIFLGVGFRDLYRQLRPARVKTVYPSELPRARVVK